MMTMSTLPALTWLHWDFLFEEDISSTKKVGVKENRVQRCWVFQLILYLHWGAGQLHSGGF